MSTLFFLVLTGLFLFASCMGFKLFGHCVLIAIGAFLLVVGAAVLANTALVFLGIATASSYLLFEPARN